MKIYHKSCLPCLHSWLNSDISYFSFSLLSMYCLSLNLNLCWKLHRLVVIGGFLQRTICYGGRNVEKKGSMKIWYMEATDFDVDRLHDVRGSLCIWGSIKLNWIGDLEKYQDQRYTKYSIRANDSIYRIGDLEKYQDKGKLNIILWESTLFI